MLKFVLFLDTFQIISPSGRSSPLICGDNDVSRFFLLKWISIINDLKYISHYLMHESLCNITFTESTYDPGCRRPGVSYRRSWDWHYDIIHNTWIGHSGNHDFILHRILYKTIFKICSFSSTLYYFNISRLFNIVAVTNKEVSNFYYDKTSVFII